VDFFSEAALRLKQELKVSEDKQVAEALGMSSNAWTMRKRRAAFPEKELRALAQRRPELRLDVEYVLTGYRHELQQRLGAVRVATERAAKVPGLTKEDQARLSEFVFHVEQGNTDELRRLLHPLQPDEALLLEAYRRCNSEARQTLIKTAALLGAGLTAEPHAEQRGTPGVHQVSTGAGTVQVGQSGGSVIVKKSRSR